MHPAKFILWVLNLVTQIVAKLYPGYDLAVEVEAKLYVGCDLAEKGVCQTILWVWLV